MVRYREATRGERAVAEIVAAADRGVPPAGLLGVIAPELDGARLLAFSRSSRLEVRRRSVGRSVGGAEEVLERGPPRRASGGVSR
jgi:hypothetical protein